MVATHCVASDHDDGKDQGDGEEAPGLHVGCWPPQLGRSEGRGVAWRGVALLAVAGR